LIHICTLGYDPIGWGVPYAGAIATDTAKPLMEAAIQTLIILLDYGHPILAPGAAEGPALPPLTSVLRLPSVLLEDTEAQGFNVFRKLLSSIETESDMNFIFRGFSRLLNNVHQSQSTFLPYSIQSVDIEEVFHGLFCLKIILILNSGANGAVMEVLGGNS
jgi:hypothetical protein